MEPDQDSVACAVLPFNGTSGGIRSQALLQLCLQHLKFLARPSGR